MVYSEFVRNKLFLDKKEKYTVRDFKKLFNTGLTVRQAKTRILWSEIYHFDTYTEHISGELSRVIKKIERREYYENI